MSILRDKRDKINIVEPAIPAEGCQVANIRCLGGKELKNPTTFFITGKSCDGRHKRVAGSLLVLAGVGGVETILDAWVNCDT